MKRLWISRDCHSHIWPSVCICCLRHQVHPFYTAPGVFTTCLHTTRPLTPFVPQGLVCWALELIEHCLSWSRISIALRRPKRHPQQPYKLVPPRNSPTDVVIMPLNQEFSALPRPLATNPGPSISAPTGPSAPVIVRANSESPSVTNKTKRYRSPDKLRDFLIQTIEQAIGRPIEQRYPNKVIDPRIDDPYPPNLYRWEFSELYKAFPTQRKGGISRWSIAEIKGCFHAIDKMYLKVVKVSGSVNQHGMNHRNSTEEDVQEVSAMGSHSLTNISRDANEDTTMPDVSMNQASVTDNNTPPSVAVLNSGSSQTPLLNLDPPLSDAQAERIMKVFNAEIDRNTPNDINSTAHALNRFAARLYFEQSFDDATRLLKEDWRTSQEIQADLKAQLQLAKNDAQSLLQQLQASNDARRGEQAQIREVQELNNLLQQEFTQKEQNFVAELVSVRDEAQKKAQALLAEIETLKAQVYEARQVGETSGREQALKDVNASTAGALLAMQRNQLEALEKARQVSYERGLIDGGRGSVNPQNADNIQHVQCLRELDELKKRHSEELESALARGVEQGEETGRAEGRASAFKEMLPRPEEGIYNPRIKSEVEIPLSARKLRELRTINSNWGDVPQTLFPTAMMPAGHVLGERTFRLLAILSKKANYTTATSLLQAEIKRRAEMLGDLSQDGEGQILTNADIRTVLDRLEEDTLMEELPSNVSTNTFFPAIPTPTVVGFESATQPFPQEPAEIPSASTSEPVPTMKQPVQAKRLFQPHQDTSTQRSSSSPLSDAPNSPASIPYLQASIPESRASVSESEAFISDEESIIDQAAQCVQTNIDREIEKIISVLPPAKDIRVPQFLEEFSGKFLKDQVVSSEKMFIKVGADFQARQCVKWPEVLRITPEHHDRAPTLGKHGVLTLVDGKPSNCGTLGQIYPTIIRNEKDKFSYIGHYRLVRREVVPVYIWKESQQEQRENIAQEILKSQWFERLLATRGLELHSLLEKDRIPEVLTFFEREDEPNLRMNWTVLELVEFNLDDYAELVTSSRAMEKVPIGIPGDLYLKSLSAWTGSATAEYLPRYRSVSLQKVDKRLLLSAPTIEKLSAEVKRLTQWIAAKPFTDLDSTKRPLAAIAMKLSKEYFLGSFNGEEDVIRLFEAIHIIFDFHHPDSSGLPLASRGLNISKYFKYPLSNVWSDFGAVKPKTSLPKSAMVNESESIAPCVRRRDSAESGVEDFFNGNESIPKTPAEVQKSVEAPPQSAPSGPIPPVEPPAISRGVNTRSKDLPPRSSARLSRLATSIDTGDEDASLSNDASDTGNRSEESPGAIEYIRPKKKQIKQPIKKRKSEGDALQELKRQKKPLGYKPVDTSKATNSVPIITQASNNQSLALPESPGLFFPVEPPTIRPHHRHSLPAQPQSESVPSGDGKETGAAETEPKVKNEEPRIEEDIYGASPPRRGPPDS